MDQYVIKSDGSKERIKFDKITSRIKNQCKGLNNKFVVPTEVTRRVAESVVDGITTEQIDGIIANEAARLVTTHPDYSILAARILISRWQKNIPLSFSDNIESLYDHIDPSTGKHAPLVSREIRDLVSKPAIARTSIGARSRQAAVELSPAGRTRLRTSSPTPWSRTCCAS